MIVLGIDLSLASCGFAIINSDVAPDVTLRWVATWQAKKQPHPERRALIVALIARLHERYRFERIICETVWLGGGDRSPLPSVAALVGLTASIEDWAYVRGIPVQKVVTSTWRKHLLGSGRAKKVDAQRFVAEQFHRELRDDAAEAVCLALYGVRYGSQQ